MKASPNLDKIKNETSGNKVLNILNGASSLYKNHFDKKIDVDGEKNMNCVMLRQVVERKDVANLLRKGEKEWVLGPVQTTLAVIVMVVAFILMMKKIFIALIFIWLMVTVLCVFNIVKKSNLSAKLETLLKDIAGSEAHYHVLLEMLRNTPYPLISKEKDSNWVYREMNNFKNKDKDFIIKESVKKNESSLKTDLLRNINK